jgi:hypothetical protein
MTLTPSPSSILGRAIQAVPAVKYALGVAGVVSVVAIVVGGWKIDPRVAVFGFIIMIVLMAVLAVFSNISAVGPVLATPLIVLVWASVLIFIAIALALFLSVFFDWPVPLRTRVFPKPADKVQIIPAPPATKDETQGTSTGSQSTQGTQKEGLKATGNSMGKEAGSSRPQQFQLNSLVGTWSTRMFGNAICGANINGKSCPYKCSERWTIIVKELKQNLYTAYFQDMYIALGATEEAKANKCSSFELPGQQSIGDSREIRIGKMQFKNNELILELDEPWEDTVRLTYEPRKGLVDEKRRLDDHVFITGGKEAFSERPIIFSRNSSLQAPR